MGENIPAWKQRDFLSICSGCSCVFTATRGHTAARARHRRRRGNSSSAGIWRRIKARGGIRSKFLIEFHGGLVALL